MRSATTATTKPLRRSMSSWLATACRWRLAERCSGGVTHLKGYASFGRQPWAVAHAGWSAGVCALRERLIQRQVVQRALDDIHLFPEVVALRPRRRRVDAAIEAQHARSHTACGIGCQNAPIQT